MEKYNKENKDNKIPCVNASVVTKWERDHGNKWFCNGGIKSTNWCCYPKYKQEGENDRNFILKLCEIVKNAGEDENNIKKWKEKYYDLLKKVVEEKNEKLNENKFKFAKKEALDKVYEKCQNKTKDNKENKVVEEKENNSKSNRDNDEENKEKDDNNK